MVWITKYRKKVLRGLIAERVRVLIREICLANDIVIVKGHISADHVHLLISILPTIGVSKIMQYLKGKTSRRLLQENAELRKMFQGQHIWARGYFAASTGTVTDEVIKEYIEKQDLQQSDEEFKIAEQLQSALAEFKSIGFRRQQFNFLRQWKGKKIVVVLDNAKYHHAVMLKSWLKINRKMLSLMFLPPYSPELNRIERVWKITRKLCTHNEYFPTLEKLMVVVQKQMKRWKEPNETLYKLCCIN